jgi:iron complex outermembrane receptor protein
MNFAYRLALMLATVPLVAPAQQPPRERIEVTGSHIPRVDAETGLPVQVITRDDIEKAGIQTPQDLLDRISAHMSFGAFTEAQGIGDSRGGYTAPSLRGLGSERTLVLLNGRRIAPYALAGGFGIDISGIPIGAIERVEVLKDGASAIYGTDAIGGVINFILRRDFRGAEASVSYSASEAGGGDSWRASAALGFGDLERDRFNVLLSLDALRQDPLRARDREYTRTAYLPDYGIDGTSTAGWPANIRQPRIINPDTGAVLRPGGFSGIRNPTVPASGATSASCLPPISFPTVNTPTACRFDYASVIDTIPESDKASAIGRATVRLAADLDAFAEGSYYHGLFVSRISPAPVIGSRPFELKPGVATYPTAFVASLPGGRTDLPVILSYRTVEFGPRVTETESEQWRGVLGLRGRRSEWDYEATLGYNGNRQLQSLTSGNFSEERLVPLLESGAINPFGLNTPEALARAREAQITGQISDKPREPRRRGAQDFGHTVVALFRPVGPRQSAWARAARVSSS